MNSEFPLSFRVIIAGGRDFNNYELLRERCDFYLSNKTNIEIVEDEANSADLLGKQYAIERNYILHKFPADWDSFGKSAGYIRNETMVLFANEFANGALIAFWNGKSKGTKHMIDLAQKHNLKVKIIYYI